MSLQRAPQSVALDESKCDMPFSEKQIQEYIWSKREEFSNLLAPSEILVRSQCSVDSVRPEDLLWNKLIDRLESLHQKLLSLELFGCEVPLERASTSTIRADFLGSFPGDTGVAIVELKKSAQTERQSFTELLAYANHLSLLFPGMSREDVVYILIAPMETRITREAFVQSLTLDHRNVIALIPKLSDPNDLKSLKLVPWAPARKDVSLLTSSAFRKSSLSVCKVVWKYCAESWNPDLQKQPSPDQIKRLNTASALAAQKMEAAGIHGFVYSSQAWSELREALPYSNSLVMVGVNPFSLGSSINAASQSEGKNHSPEGVGLLQVIPGLEKSDRGQFGAMDYLDDLRSVWDSQLFRIGKSVIDSVTLSTEKGSLDTDSGFMNWDEYQSQIIEDVCCHNFDVRPTGFIRDLFLDVTSLDYAHASQAGVENHLIHGDMHRCAADGVVSQVMFRKFLDRMLGDDESSD